MALFAISDLHLPGPYGEAKSMEVFEDRWRGYTEKLERNWRACVGPEDSVVIPGDISWAMRLSDAAYDLKFIDSLPGTKYLGKGNHDFWWTTVSSMHKLFEELGLSTLHVLYNNSYVLPECAIVGSRGWYLEPENQRTVEDTDWNKISQRELIRLQLSISSLPQGTDMSKVCLFLHFPPVYAGSESKELVELIRDSGIKRCFYGHVHGYYGPGCDFEHEGIRFEMISADRLNFTPKLILPSPAGGSGIESDNKNEVINTERTNTK